MKVSQSLGPWHTGKCRPEIACCAAPGGGNAQSIALVPAAKPQWEAWAQPAQCQPPPCPALLPKGQGTACPGWPRSQPGSLRPCGSSSFGNIPPGSLETFCLQGGKCTCRTVGPSDWFRWIQSYCTSQKKASTGGSGLSGEKCAGDGARVCPVGRKRVARRGFVEGHVRGPWGNSAWGSGLSVHVGL